MAQQELVPGNPRELGEQFKFIAEVTELIPADEIEENFDQVNLICTANRFGLIFIAHKNFLKAFRTKDFIDKGEKSPASTFSCRGSVTHISVSCDGLILFVVAIVNNCPFGFFYDVRNILESHKETVPFYTIPLNASAHSRVISLAWNPCDPTCIALAFSTGDLSLVKIKETSVEFSNKNDLLASAVTWSAKGKQLAVGKTDGTMSLFKPDLTFVRSVQAPSVPDIGHVFDITWFTNTEFFIGYHIKNVGPALFYVNAPKGKPATLVNFDDVCFSNDSKKPVTYYTVFISEWSLLLVFSSNGVEMGVIGKTEVEDGAFNWCLWSPDEDAKALMHFYNVIEETYPLGLVIDFTSTKRFLSKDENMKGPFPFLATISSKGELNVFFMENNLPNSQSLAISCEAVPSTGHRTPEQFGQPTTSIMEPLAAETPPPEPKPNFMSAFSSFPKKSESSTPTPILFSTPLKSVTISSDGPSKPAKSEFVAGNPATSTSSLPFSGFPPASSGIFSLTSGASVSTLPSFSNSLFSKPVSMSNQIGSVGLPAPSPQKSENFLGMQPSNPLVPISSVSQPQTLNKPQTFTQTLPSNLAQPQTLAQPLNLGQPQTLAQPLNLGQPQILAQPLNLGQPQTLTQPPSLTQSPTLAQPLSVQLKAQTPIHESTPPPPSPKLSKETVLYHIQREEQQFEKELKKITESVGLLEKEVGKDKDMEFKVSLDKIKEWMKDMESTTKEQSDEVGILHQETLEALALYEDAKSHRLIKFNSRNEIYTQLRPLDPYSKRKLDEIRFKYKYLISQIKDVNEKLDLQFEELTKARKSKRNQRPPDNLHRTVLNLHTMRIAAEKELQKVTSQIKKLHINPIFSSSYLNSSINGKCEKLQNILNDSMNDLSSMQSPSRSSSSTERNRQLKEILAQREHTPVRIHSVDSTPESVSKEEVQQCTSAMQRNVDEIRFSSPLLDNRNKPVYEDISPAGSLAQANSSSNPLAALSSLVGKVSSAAPTLNTTSIATQNSMNLLPASKTDVPSFSSFSFSQMSKSSLGTLPLNDAKKDSQSNSDSFSLFGSHATQVQSPKSSLSFSKDLFAGNKLNSQVFSGIAISQANTPILPVKTEATSPSTSKSPLLEMLSTTKGISDPTTSVTPNFAQFFKGVSPASSVSTLTSATAVPTTTAASLSFPSFLKTNDKDTKSSLSPSPSIPSVSFSGFGLKPSTTEISSKFSLSQDQEKSPSEAVKTTADSTSVISSNPILTSQILRETSIIACSSTSSSTNSNTFKGSLFGGLTNNATPLFSLRNASGVPSSSKESTPPSSSGTSLFSQPSSQPSIFGNSNSSSGTSLFSQPSSQPSIFGNSNSISVATSSSISTPSIFSTPATSVSSFGQPSINTTTTLSQLSSTNTLFTTAAVPSVQENSAAISITKQTTSPNAFPILSSASGSLFSSQNINTTCSVSSSVPSSEVLSDTSPVDKTTTANIPTTTVLSSSASTFGTSTKSSLFGQSGSSLFSSGQTSEPSVSSSVGDKTTVFGQPTSTPSLFSTVTTSASSFGLLSNSNSMFGNAQNTTNSLFGQTSSAQLNSSASSSIFSVPTSQGDKTVSSSTAVSIPSVFGSANAFVASSAPSIFGESTISSTFGATTSQSIFGGGFAPASTAPSIFGKPTTEVTQSAAPSLFGAASSSSSVFGGASNPPAFTSSSFGSGSVFGQANKPEAAIGSGSAWGSTSGSVFGTGAKNESSVFGNNGAASVSSTGTIFGGAISTPSSGSIFGGTTSVSSTGSIFGGAASTSSVFGTSNTSSLFSQNSFGQNTGASPFGSGTLFSGLGKAPNKEDSSKNVFGAVKSEISSQPNIFGGGGSGSQPTESAFGGPFSSQKTGGAFSPIKSGPTFGGSPIFGGSPTFGDANKPKSIFGGSATFGSSSVLGGGTTSIFGSNTGTFAQPSSPSGGFSTFAANSGGTSFSSLANQGGSSFSSWR